MSTSPYIVTLWAAMVRLRPPQIDCSSGKNPLRMLIIWDPLCQREGGGREREGEREAERPRQREGDREREMLILLLYFCEIFNMNLIFCLRLYWSITPSTKAYRCLFSIKRSILIKLAEPQRRNYKHHMTTSQKSALSPQPHVFKSTLWRQIKDRVNKSAPRKREQTNERERRKGGRVEESETW